MTSKHLQELIKNLQELYKCLSCETSYHFDDIKFLGEVDTLYFVQLTCHGCSLPLLATVHADGKRPKRAKTDLRQTEEVKFAHKGAITALEIAEFHRALSGVRGSLGKLVK